MAENTRDVTVTFGDGTSHKYAGVPINVSPDDVEQRALKDFGGKKITNIDGGIKPADKPIVKKEDKSALGTADKYATKIFGAGPPADMPLVERAIRVGEAGVGGMAIGGVIGAGLGLIGGPLFPATVPAMASGGAIIGGVGGAFEEIQQQVSSSMGGGRTAQVLSGLLASFYAGPAAELSKAGASITASAIKNLTHPGRVLGKIGDLVMPERAAAAAEMSPSTAELRRQADEATRKKLLQGTEGAKEEVGAALQGSVKEQAAQEQQKVLERQQRALELKARAEKGKTGAVTAVEKQINLTEQEKRLAKETGVGETTSPYSFGTKIQTEVESVRDPKLKAMHEDYNAAYTASMESAAKAEASGAHWQDSAEAMKVKQKWSKEAPGRSGPVGDKIKAILNDIWRQKRTIVGENGVEKVIKPTPINAKGIDEKIRQLGEVAYGKEVSGYEGITAAVAKELRNDLIHGVEEAGGRAGGFYDWSGLGPAKSKYAQSLKDLETYKTSRGAAIVGEKSKDVEELSKKVFGSESGLKELQSMLPPDKVKELAIQHTKNELAGKDKEQVGKWLREHKFIGEAVPEAKVLAENYMNKLSSLEDKSLRLQDQLAQTRQGALQTWSDSIDKRAQGWVDNVKKSNKETQQRFGLTEKEVFEKDSAKIVDDLFNTPNRQQMAAVAKHLTDIPAMQKAMPDAAAEWLFKRPTSSLLKDLDRMKPALEGAGLNKTQIASLEKGVNEIIAANKLIAKRGEIPNYAKQEAAAKFKKLFRSAFAVKTGAAGVVGGQAGVEGTEMYKEQNK